MIILQSVGALNVSRVVVELLKNILLRRAFLEQNFTKEIDRREILNDLQLKLQRNLTKKKKSDFTK